MFFIIIQTLYLIKSTISTQEQLEYMHNKYLSGFYSHFDRNLFGKSGPNLLEGILISSIIISSEKDPLLEVRNSRFQLSQSQISVLSSYLSKKRRIFSVSCNFLL